MKAKKKYLEEEIEKAESYSNELGCKILQMQQELDKEKHQLQQLVESISEIRKASISRERELRMEVSRHTTMATSRITQLSNMKLEYEHAWAPLKNMTINSTENKELLEAKSKLDLEMKVAEEDLRSMLIRIPVIIKSEEVAKEIEREIEEEKQAEKAEKEARTKKVLEGFNAGILGKSQNGDQAFDNPASKQSEKEEESEF